MKSKVRSRRARFKRKRESRLAVLYIVLAIGIMMVLVIWGVPAMARLAGTLFTNDTNVPEIEELAPTPPVFSDVPESTSSAKVNIGGFAQPGVEVVLVKNGAEEKRVMTNDAGIFEFGDIDINEGENKISAYTVTSRGTESESSREYIIKVDRTAPELTLSEPEDGKVFQGQKERIATFKGLVNEDGVHVYVGEQMAIVSTDNSFQLDYQLVEGDQKIIVKAVDRAGNEATKEVSLKWEP